MARKVYYGAKGLLKLVEDQGKRIKNAKVAMEEIPRMLAEEGVKDSIQLTGGTLTRKQTRGQYARGLTASKSTATGRKRGRAPALPINMVSGRLRRSFERKRRGKTIQDVVSSNIDYAQFILSPQGTRKMVTRPLKKEVTKRGKARNYAVRAHFKKAIEK